jgi:hypothetical protein
MQAISHELKFDWNTIAPDSNQSKQAVLLKNRFMLFEGTFNLKHWLALGFLVCRHDNEESQKREFWQLLNPRLSQTISLDSLVEQLAVLIVLSVDMRLAIEEATSKNPYVVTALNDLDGLDRRQLVAKLMNYSSLEVLQSEV